MYLEEKKEAVKKIIQSIIEKTGVEIEEFIDLAQEIAEEMREEKVS